MNVDRLADLFLNRTDVVAAVAPWGKPSPVYLEGDGLRLAIAAHVGQTNFSAAFRTRAGSTVGPIERVGAYTPALDGTTKWLCIDLDGKNHAAGLKDPLRTADQTVEALRGVGLDPYLERSGSGHGYHVWVFFEAPVPAWDVRTVAFGLLPQAQLANGGPADPLKNQGIEVFPKTDSLGEGDLGNMVWLPFWAGAPKGNCRYYERVADGRRKPVKLDDIKLSSVTNLWLACERLRPVPEPSAQAPAKPRGVVDWSGWRTRALEALDLNAVYGEWLTGKRAGSGWLVCRDPDSPSGDRTPSAHVADRARDAERGTFKSHRDGRKVSCFDFLVERGVCSSVEDAFAHVAQLSGVSLPTKERERGPAQGSDGIKGGGRKPAGPRKPKIIVNARQLQEVVADATKALREARSPQAFARGGRLAVVSSSGGRLSTSVLSKDGTLNLLARSAVWKQARKDKEGNDYEVDVAPPEAVVRAVHGWSCDDLPSIDILTTAPVLTPSGVSRPGYQDGVFFRPSFRALDLPSDPSLDSVERARNYIDDNLFVDFPFSSNAEKANAWAMLLTPFVRPSIDGVLPLFLIEAPGVGTGKSLLTDIVHLAFVGRPASAMTMPPNDDEFRKVIASLMALGRPIIAFDNLPRSGTKSAAFASAVTAHDLSFRLLGGNTMFEARNLAMWVANGNNPNLSVDLVRRTARIRMDSGEARPWLRTEFTHPDLRGWVRANRAKLCQAILTLLIYWDRRGRPPGDVRVGSFEAWSSALSGILDNIGITGFMANRAELMQEGDEDTAETEEFCQCWYERYGGTKVKATLLAELIREKEILPRLWGPAIRANVGRFAREIKGCRFGPYKVCREYDADAKSFWYRLEKDEDDE